MCLLENAEGGKVFQCAGERFLFAWRAGKKKVFVLVLSGEGDAGCRDGAQRAGGAGVVPEPES